MTGHRAPVYDRIGGQYHRGRRADPRIAQRIWTALGDASPVVNVGAGGGSYEPNDRQVVAVEPSEVMIAQRPAGAAPVVRAVAEQLPFGDKAFGAALAVLTVHHWSDRGRGLAELTRVASRVVLFTRDPRAVPWWWLHHYFPATAELEASRETPIDQLEFNAAYWRRPAAYLDPTVWQPMSALALIPEADRAAGMRRRRADIEDGEWHRRWGDLVALEELDLGYRVLITT